MSIRKKCRFQFEEKGSQHTCPSCGKRRHYSRYIDIRTGNLIPEYFGWCNNAGKCGYKQNPYLPDERGHVYARIIYEQERQDWQLSGKQRYRTDLTRSKLSKPEYSKSLIYSLPDEIFKTSLAHYNQNRFAHLLQTHFGISTANQLLKQFQIGTSAFWPGACVFWLIDNKNLVRGGQVVLFDENGSTQKKRDKQNRVTFRHTLPVGWVLNESTKRRGQLIPFWLTDYLNHAPKSPICFGLHQLINTSQERPIAIVEAPATAVFCAGYFPAFIWLAICSLSYLTADRLALIKHRKIRLFPDLSEDSKAYQQWYQTAEQLRTEGFSIEVDLLLESNASSQQRTDKYDLRDFLIEQWPGYPPSWDSTTL